MNPLILAKIGQALQNFFKSKWGARISVGVIVLIIFLVGRKVVAKNLEKRKKEKAIKDFNRHEGTDLNALANQYLAASMPWGFESTINMDGTDTDLIMNKLADQTKGNLELVSSQYRKIDPEGLPLSQRMNKELDSEDFSTWNSIVT